MRERSCIGIIAVDKFLISQNDDTISQRKKVENSYWSIASTFRINMQTGTIFQSNLNNTSRIPQTVSSTCLGKISV